MTPAEARARARIRATQWESLSLDEGVRILTERIDSWFRGSHYVDVRVRRNGRDELHEADWLKFLPGFVVRLKKARGDSR